MSAVGELIKRWRRLELSQWRGLLDLAQARTRRECAAQWWPHVYGIVRAHVEGSEGQDGVTDTGSGDRVEVSLVQTLGSDKLNLS